MTFSTDSLFLTNEFASFKEYRETRADLFTTILVCTAGYIDLYYRGEMLRVGRNHIFIRVPHATELGPYKASEDYQFMQLSVPVSLFESLMFGNMRVEPNWWAKQEFLKTHPIFQLNEVSMEFCRAYFRLLALQTQDKLTEYRKHILMLTARGISMELLNFLDKQVAFSNTMNNRQSVNSSDYIFRTFVELLRQYPHEREVQWFAEQLKITPKYLSEICKDRSGKSASEWIAEVTVAELKHYLRETTLPIREVANVMEFPNASFFCQYTKKHLGMTPNHYRKQRQA